MKFYTGDTHFRFNDTIVASHRPFVDMKHQDMFIQNQWNRIVQSDDEVYIVGDMFDYDEAETHALLSRLNGKKFLLLGNHDYKWYREDVYLKYFEFVGDYLEIKDGDNSICLSHYPMVSYHNDKTSFMIHGHIHDRKFDPFWEIIADRNDILNAGVDVNSYVPVTLSQLIENNKVYKAQWYSSQKG